jgi:hypothetical protein
MANPICRVSGDYVVVAVEAEVVSELEETMARMRLPLEHVANVADKAHKVLRRRRPVEVNAAWSRRFLPTESLSQHLEMPARVFKTICHSSLGRRIC